MIGPRHLEELPRTESLRLLASIPVGRVVFSHLALPAIRPVNHVVIGEEIIIRADLGTAVSNGAGIDGGMVVAYQGDLLDAGDRTGWSVVVVGRARRVTGEAEAVRYRRMLRPWVVGAMADIIAIRVEVVTGFRLVPGDPAA